MKFRNLVALAAQSGFLHTGNAQSLQYVTELVTECFDPWQTDLEYSASPTDAWSAPQHTSGTVEYQMPECTCGCKTCVHTSVYSTSYPVFCSTGLSDQPYTITETYAGMSALPTFAEPTECPYGFTTSEVTCTVCGDKPITQTMTYPAGGVPYDTGLQSAYPTLAPTQTKSSSPEATTKGSSPAGSYPAAEGNGSSPVGGYPVDNDWTDDENTSKTTKTQSVTLSVNGTHQQTSPAQGSYPSSKPDSGSYPSSKPDSGSYPAAGGSPAAQGSQSAQAAGTHPTTTPVHVSGASRLGSALGFVAVLAAVVAALA